jgi:hypothetical protein
MTGNLTLKIKQGPIVCAWKKCNRYEQRIICLGFREKGLGQGCMGSSNQSKSFYFNVLDVRRGGRYQIRVCPHFVLFLIT